MDEQFYDSNNSYETPSQEIPVYTPPTPKKREKKKRMGLRICALALGLVGLGLYSAEYADAAHTKQNLRIGPVSAGDAKALMDKLTELGAADKAASTAA